MLIGIPYWIGALILAAVIVVVLVAMEARKPWRDEMGNDVDGDITSVSTPSPKTIRAVPAE